MENYSYSSYPDSRDSSPRSREVDLEHQSWEDQQQVPPNSNYKVKFMCSYGGKIHPRPHDHQLSYVGGDTKILSVERSVKFSVFMSKLSALCESPDLCFKYQLPGEDLDALISVTNDEDLEHMMIEYDRVYRASAKPARLRLFLFPLNPSAPGSFGSGEPKSERQWFVDALNSVQIQPLEDASPQGGAAADSSNPDFLFGFDKGFQQIPPGKLQEAMPPPKVAVKDVTAGSDCGSEDRHLMGEPVVSPAEIQRQMQDLQRMQISTHEQACQAMFNRTGDDGGVPRNFPGEYYPQKAPEKFPPSAQAPIPVPVPMPVPASYYPDRHMTTAGYPISASSGAEQPVYFIPSMYQQAPQTMRTVTGQMGQGYYGMQRMAAPSPEVYRDQPVYNPMQPPPPQLQQQQAMGMVPQPQKVPVPEQGYAQVGYDSSGRQVYYTTSPGGMVQQQYQAAPAAVDGRQGGGAAGGGAMNQEGKVVVKTPQSPV